MNEHVKQVRTATELIQEAVDKLTRSWKDKCEELSVKEDEIEALESNASDTEEELAEAKTEAELLRADRELLLGLVGLTEHEFECSRSKFAIAGAAEFLHERLASVAGV